MISTLELQKIEKLVKQRGKDKKRDVQSEMQSEGILGRRGGISVSYGGKDRPVAQGKLKSAKAARTK